MTIFVDASAAVSMLMLEPDAEFLFGLLDDDQDRLWSPIAVWETTVAITRTRVIQADRAYDDVNALAERLGFKLMRIGQAETFGALAAFARYGKRSGSPANLNLGDCFAYACAKTSGARLLYKGDDFTHTDLA
ncbi:MAG TPA: type II toxin-antitoxin system VapC family toxin [Sphingomonas sp.]